MNDGQVRHLAKIMPSLVNNLWWDIVMDDWNLDENSIASDSKCNNVNLQSPQQIYKEWQIMLG